MKNTTKDTIRLVAGHARLIAPIAALLMASTAATAQTSCQRIGSQTFCNGPSGFYSSQRMGDFTYGRYSDGTTTSSQRIGDFTYGRRSDGATYSSQRIGDFTYGRNNDGVTSTTQRIGEFQYINRSNGTRTTCQRIGATTYCN